MPRVTVRISLRSIWLAVAALACASAASAQSEGGLYIAGAGFSFQAAAERAMAENPGGRRFFLLSLPPESAALSASATGARAKLRSRVVAANGVLLVCQRDIDNGKIRRSGLAAGVVAVRGWPRSGNDAMPDGQRYFVNEDPAQLPASDEALRRLRSTCA
jgi:hypothetical protein